MPKYLIQANYVREGVKGLLQGGAAPAVAPPGQAVQSQGGTVEAFYYAFGETGASSSLICRTMPPCRRLP
ncbi:MAG: hypothetical protein U1E63_12090 [Burkholderiales bacterium]